MLLGFSSTIHSEFVPVTFWAVRGKPLTRNEVVCRWWHLRLITCSIHQKHLPPIWLKMQILVNDCFGKRGKNTSGQTKLQQGDLQKKTAMLKVAQRCTRRYPSRYDQKLFNCKLKLNFLTAPHRKQKYSYSPWVSQTMKEDHLQHRWRQQNYFLLHKLHK